MGRSESPGEKKQKKAKKTKRSESAGKKDGKKDKKRKSSSVERKEAEASAKSGPKLAFRFKDGTAPGGDALARSAVDILGGSKRRRPKEEELRRRSFTVEELAALAQLAGSGLQAVKAQVADGQGVAVHLISALNPSRKLGQAEKVLLKAILEPENKQEDQPLGIGPELLQAFGLIPKPRASVEESNQAIGTSETPPPPPGGLVPSTFTSPPPPPPTPGDPGALLQSKRIVPLEDWPPPSPDAVEQMLNRFPQLDGICRGSLMNLPPQFALAILWDMDAKGGPEEIRDPQGFVFSATQTLMRLPVPMGGCAPVAPVPGLAAAPVAAPLAMPTFVGAA